MRRLIGNGKLKIYFGDKLVCFVCENIWFAQARIVFDRTIVLPKIPSTISPILSRQNDAEAASTAEISTKLKAKKASTKKAVNSQKASSEQTTQDNDINVLPPVFERYAALKAQHPQHLLLMCVEANYEAYYDDAESIARTLGLVLTSKKAFGKQRTPMVWFLVPTLQSHLNALLESGFSCAIATEKTAKWLFR